MSAACFRRLSIPPCQNSCRLVMIFNFGAIRNKYGTLPRDIEEQTAGARLEAVITAAALPGGAYVCPFNYSFRQLRNYRNPPPDSLTKVTLQS